MKYLLIALLLVLLSGCGHMQGFVRDSVTQVQVQKAGFEIVKTDIGAAVNISYLLCIIPVGNVPPYYQAMRDLHKAAQLGRNQMLVNIREDHEMSFMLLYCVQTYTLSADVIEFR